MIPEHLIYINTGRGIPWYTELTSLLDLARPFGRAFFFPRLPNGLAA
jgi:hypothetical protein